MPSTCNFVKSLITINLFTYCMELHDDDDKNMMMMMMMIIIIIIIIRYFSQITF